VAWDPGAPVRAPRWGAVRTLPGSNFLLGRPTEELRGLARARLLSWSVGRKELLASLEQWRDEHVD
jgi:hypothetical protein